MKDEQHVIRKDGHKKGGETHNCFGICTIYRPKISGIEAITYHPVNTDAQPLPDTHDEYKNAKAEFERRLALPGTDNFEKSIDVETSDCNGPDCIYFLDRSGPTMITEEKTLEKFIELTVNGRRVFVKVRYKIYLEIYRGFCYHVG